jgi:SOS response regulatory protein OraA/RecX
MDKQTELQPEQLTPQSGQKPIIRYFSAQETISYVIDSLNKKAWDDHARFRARIANIARNLLKRGISIEDIADITGLTVDEIEELKQE